MLNCVYCGNSKVTKEHISGSWSRKYVNRTSGIDKTFHVLTKFPDGAPEYGLIQSKGALDRPGHPRSNTLKIACKACNEGWMHRIIENAIEPIKDLSFGYWGRWPNSKRQEIASWITLLSMSYEFADRSTVAVPQAERDNFRLSGRPSDRWRIAIGYAEPDDLLAEPRFHRAFKIVDPANIALKGKGCITGFLFGKLLAVSLYCDVELEIDWINLANYFGLSYIWPSTDRVAKPFRTHSGTVIESLVPSISEHVMTECGMHKPSQQEGRKWLAAN